MISFIRGNNNNNNNEEDKNESESNFLIDRRNNNRNNNNEEKEPLGLLNYYDYYSLAAIFFCFTTYSFKYL